VAKPDVRANEQTKILVVADDVSNRSLLAAVLTTLGYSALKAPDDVTALALVAQNSVSGILIDVEMPHIEGLEVGRRLKRDTDTAHIPVILVTAPADQKRRQLGIEAGADEFVSKPVVVAELLEVLRRVLPNGRHSQMTGSYGSVQSRW
jgi:CheY-like chemotaxis protein